MKKLMRIMLPSLALVLMTAAPLMAEDGKRLFNRKGCTSCHGTDAKSTITGAYPKLAGQHKDYIVSQLKAFQGNLRAGSKADSISYENSTRTSVGSKQMIPFARSLNAEQTEIIAAYISSLN